MPKQVYKILQFHGGLSSNSDPRDIAENELSDATDIVVSELGKVRMLGGNATHGTMQARANQINPGYGLFQFSHDRRDGHTAGAGTEVETDYMVFSEPDTAGTVDIYSNEDDDFQSPITGMTNNSSGLRADVFYIVDGALRVCDSDFGNDNDSKWYGYVDRTHFSGFTPGGSADTYNTWLVGNAELAAPTVGIAGLIHGVGDATGTTNLQDSSFFHDDWDTQLDAGSHVALNKIEHKSLAISARLNTSNVTTAAADDWNTDQFTIFPDPGTGFNLYVPTPTSGSFTIPTGTYEFGSTFIYDAEPGDLAGRDQESLIFTMAGTASITLGQYWNGIWVQATSPYNARITGGRIYTRIENSGNEWQILIEISLKDGVRVDPLSSFDDWDLMDAGPTDLTSIHLYGSAFNRVFSLLPITYSMNAGIDQDASSSTAKYKTAVVTNRTAYVGNVQYDSTTYGDAVFKSPVNKFDVFSSDRRLEANINDGDSIVKLETYADRLLIFKKRKLELLNISQEIEFIEDTFAHKGVSHTAATCKTDFGIAWVNRQGCYLYDGQKVSNLLEKGGRQIIKEDDWDGFTTDSSIIGYIPKKRQLIVLKDCTATSTGDIYLFDLVTQSWVKGDSAFTDNKIQTNFVTDWNGDLVHIHTSDIGTVVKWDDAADTSTAMVMTTKDIDFGEPAVRKKIYKVYITYRGNATHVQVHYGVDGLAPALTFNNITSGTDGSSTGSGSNAKCIPYDAGVTDWLKAELKPSASINNINSFRLKLSGDGSNAIATDFEINDISIVYRGKNVK